MTLVETLARMACHSSLQSKHEFHKEIGEPKTLNFLEDKTYKLSWSAYVWGITHMPDMRCKSTLESYGIKPTDELP